MPLYDKYGSTAGNLENSFYDPERDRDMQQITSYQEGTVYFATRLRTGLFTCDRANILHMLRALF